MKSSYKLTSCYFLLPFQKISLTQPKTCFVAKAIFPSSVSEVFKDGSFHSLLELKWSFPSVKRSSQRRAPVIFKREQNSGSSSLLFTSHSEAESMQRGRAQGHIPIQLLMWIQRQQKWFSYDIYLSASTLLYEDIEAFVCVGCEKCRLTYEWGKMWWKENDSEW